MESSLRLAAVTAVYNEVDMLEQFLRHYMPQCDAIIVLDNESTKAIPGDVIRGMKMNGICEQIQTVTYSTDGKFDTAKKQAELMRVKKELIGKVDYVMILDCDEFIVPKAGGLIKDHLGKEDIYATHGVNIYCYPEDLPYDPAIPLTQQRKRGIENYHYSKPIIVRPSFPVTYAPGCHYVTNTLGNAQILPAEQAPFWLLHFRGYDEDVYVRRALDRATRVDVHNPVDGASVGGYYWGGDEGTFRAKYQYERDAGRAIQPIP